LDLDSAARTPLLHAAIARYERYAASARKHLPFHTQVVSRLVCTWNFYWQYGSAGLFYNPWERSSLPAKIMKVVQGFIYLLVVFLGTVIGIVRMIRPSGDLIARLIPWIAVTSMLVIPLGFRLTEYRYSVPYFAFLAMMVFDQALRWWRYRRGREAANPDGIIRLRSDRPAAASEREAAGRP
jgi:hypothetical protein